MIRYTLRCGSGHRFDAWFQSAAAYDAQGASARIVCPECGDANVEKAVMAPRIATEQPRPDRTLHARRLAALRRAIEAGSEDVGTRFAERARAMHLGDEPARAIRSHATGREATALLEDGVAILPLPGDLKTRAN